MPKFIIAVWRPPTVFLIGARFWSWNLKIMQCFRRICRCLPENKTKKDPVAYKFENKILYLTKALGFKEDPGQIFKYVNGNLIPQNKKSKLDLIFKPSLNNYFNKIK